MTLSCSDLFRCLPLLTPLSGLKLPPCWPGQGDSPGSGMSKLPPPTWEEGTLLFPWSGLSLYAAIGAGRTSKVMWIHEYLVDLHKSLRPCYFELWQLYGTTEFLPGREDSTPVDNRAASWGNIFYPMREALSRTLQGLPWGEYSCKLCCCLLTTLYSLCLWFFSL